MMGNRLERLLERIGWPRGAYEGHRDAVSPGCGHAEDLYVAGAAGYRVEAAWVVIEEDHGARCRGILGRVATADLSPEDLWGETLVRLMADEPGEPGGKGEEKSGKAFADLPDGRRPARIIRFRGLVPLRNYLITIARRHAVSRNRKRKPEVGLPVAAEGQHDPAGDPLERAASNEAAGGMAAAMRRAVAGLSVEERFLIAMVYGQGMKQKEVGRLLGWSEFKVSRAMKKAIETLQEAISTESEASWGSAEREAWEKMWQSAWDDVQEPAGLASDQVKG